MTALRQSAMMELEKLPEDKLSFIIQIMQGVNGLYTDTESERGFFVPHLALETFWKHRRVCLDGMLYFIDVEFYEGYN